MIIDAHQHYWSLERGDYGWLTPDLSAIYRDFLPEDLKPHLDKEEVVGTVIVQAAETEAETRFLLDIAKSNTSVLGVVGWLDLAAPDFDARLDALIAYGDGYLKGIRPMIQDNPDPNWVLRPELDSAFATIAARGLVFDALVLPFHLTQLETRLRRHPNLKCVIDHGAKPDIANHIRSAWCEAMGSLARNTSAVCKLSGLVTEAGDAWTGSDIKPYIGDLLHHFGADRLLWGSDWPVLNLASDYPTWLSLARQACATLSRAEQEQIFSQNAAEIYGLEVLCLQ